MKPKGKILSLLLAICLVVGLMPTAAFAAGTDTGKAIQLVDSGTAANIGGGQADNIYFGTYQQSSDGNGGYNTDPVKWRVLENADGQLFLLSDQNLDVFQYHTDYVDYESVTWEKSTMRSWLNGYGASENTGGNSGIDYTSDNFIDHAFSEKEQAAIADTEVVNDDNPEHGTEGGNNTTDKIFLLSIAEANNSSYFADNSSRISTNTAYVAGGGKISSGGMYGVGVADYWWLRSPGGEGGDAAGVYLKGGVDSRGIDVYFAYNTVRPAFHLDLKSVLFTSAAIGGKSANGMDSRLTVVDNYDSNEWKLTLLDESRNFSISNAATNSSGDTITFSYSGAQTGANEYISVMIEDNGAITHYGRILQLDGTTNGTNGTVSLTLPAGITLDNDTKLYVFNEQYNGGENDDTKLTDYGSKLIDVQSAVDTTAPTLTAGTATRDSETAATVKFTSDEAGTYYYAVVESGATEPTIDTTGTGTSCDTTEQTISLDNLSGTGAKDIYIVAKDAVGNVSNTLKITIPVIYTLTVNLNGGNGTTTGGEYTEGEEISIDAGTKSGYRFTSWTSSNGGTFADASSASTTFTMPANDTTITANWKKKSSGGSVFFWDLKFDTNGGSKIDTVTEWEYSTIDLDDYVPEKEGYKFVGWYADEDLTKEIDEVYLTQDTTVYAKWEKIAEEVSEETEEVEETEETETISFLDVKKSDWFYDAVSYAVENGLMSGMSEDIFAPNTPLTREMLAVVLYNVEGQPESTGVNPFTDVKTDMWYTDAILWANENGIVAGYDNGAYGVGDLITREQFAAILYRYAQFKGYDVSVGADTNILSYTDALDISEYAYPAMQWACGADVMGGMDDGTLMPQGKATRAEAATMLMNFCENVVK